MSKIKSVSTYDGSNWGTAVPLGADDVNVDITSATTNPTVSTSTVANLTSADVTVASGDNNATAWTKFNKFRNRVAKTFGNYITGSIQTSYNATGSNTAVYPTSVINNYMKNVIGLTGTSTPTINGSAQTVTSALSSLSNSIIRPNLLDNWYFVGGGSQLGDGIFPINRQGQTTYEPNQSNTFLIDRWKTGTSTGKLQLHAASMSGTNNFLIEQIVGNINEFGGKTLTVSILTSQGLFSSTDVCPTTAPASSTTNLRAADIYRDGSRVGYADVIVNSIGQVIARIRVFEGYIAYFWAIKLELGDTQTLAHQEGNTWVLNEIPNWYETEFRCRPDLFETVRENLLDNWYFVGNGSQNGHFPINQRGQGYYTNAGVTIDRWFKGTNGAINSITKAYGLLITPNTALYQKLSTETKDALDGNTCTLTLLTNDGKIRSGTFVYKSAPSSTITILNVAGVVKFECGTDGNIYITWLSSSNTGYFAVKLELGDTQTLAHQEGNTWVLNEIPAYAEQLAKCQRYYQRYGNAQTYRVFAIGYMQSATSARFFLPLSVPMVKKPTATINGTLYFNYGTSSTRVEITEYSVNNWDNQQVFFAGTTASSIAVGTVGEIMNQNTTVESIELSAE